MKINGIKLHDSSLMVAMALQLLYDKKCLLLEIMMQIYIIIA
jgi:hypothetical protein